MAVRSKTLGDDIFRRILGKIHSGELAPGDVINETVLATEFGVSRGPVREAVRRLQGIQLVTHEAFLKARVVDLSPGVMLELFQMREALEGYACRLAAERMSRQEVDALIGELERSRSGAMEEVERPVDEVFDFHVRIVNASGNRRIIDSLCGDLYHLLRMYRRHSGSVTERKSAAFTEHWQILRAIRAHDGDLAESLMRAHIRRATEHLETSLAPRSGLQGRSRLGSAA